MASPFRGTETDLDDWTTALEGADVVINLAGRSVNCRTTTPATGREILESRNTYDRTARRSYQRTASAAAFVDQRKHGDHLPAQPRSRDG